LDIDGANNRLSGTLRDGANTAVVEAWRQIWAEQAGAAAEVEGAHSFYLEPTDKSVQVPQGYGFGTLLVAGKDGRFVLNGVLPDSGKFTGTGFVGPTGEVTVYSAFFAKIRVL